MNEFVICNIKWYQRIKLLFIKPFFVLETINNTQYFITFKRMNNSTFLVKFEVVP